MKTLTPREKALLAKTDIGRLATVSRNGWPHVVPVSYVYSAGSFYVPSGKGSVKTKNLGRSPRATIVVDDVTDESGVMFECDAAILLAAEAKRWRRIMRDSKGWKNNGRTSIIRLRPTRKASWFLKG